MAAQDIELDVEPEHWPGDAGALIESDPAAPSPRGGGAGVATAGGRVLRYGHRHRGRLPTGPQLLGVPSREPRAVTATDQIREAIAAYVTENEHKCEGELLTDFVVVAGYVGADDENGVFLIPSDGTPGYTARGLVQTAGDIMADRNR